MNKTLLLSLVVASVIGSNNMQLKANLESFEKVFEPLSELGAQLFMQIQSKIVGGATVGQVDEHIEELKGHLTQDQEQDDKYFQEEEAKLQEESAAVDAELKELLEQQNYLEQKLHLLNEQSNLIDNLFAVDQQAYTERMGTQNAMLETIEQLTAKVHEHLIDGHSLLETTDLFQSLKQIGRGKHVEALAQLTAHLDQLQVDKILELFEHLKVSIQESINADESKQQENIRLHTALRAELGELIPTTNQNFVDLLDQVEQQVGVKSEVKKRLNFLGEEFSDRTDSRRFALDNAKEAQKLLQDNLDRLTRWESPEE